MTKSKAQSTSIFQDYLDYTKKFQDKYGPLAIVLLQVGSFFELYKKYDTVDWGLKKACEIMSINITRKNKKKKDSAFMAGFPLHSLPKFVNILLKHHYKIHAARIICLIKKCKLFH